MKKAPYNKAIVYWLLSGALLITGMVVIGGITRLTRSGLSIVEWNVISGTLPPLSQAAWLEAFEKYKLFPEYQKLNFGMTLDGFKKIFWWEYLHRLLGRIIGFVFILPFLHFLLTKQLSGWLFRRLLFILLLGLSQGLMGWIMVKSGLVDMPHVSHYRLAAHFILALLLIGTIVWTVADITTAPRQQKATTPILTRLSRLVLTLILVQIVYGAFVAGLKAGFSYNTYPLMEGEFFPAYLKSYFTWQHVLEDGVVVQFIHRWVAALVLAGVVWFWYSSRNAAVGTTTKNTIVLLLVTALVQLVLGIATLLLAVPVTLGVLHQLVAVAMFVLALLAVHQLQPLHSRAGNSGRGNYQRVATRGLHPKPTV
ncbi:COX15/CtaA family protein [Botryobacter ruber]|uniref:COX15/CtaA family protein n=1 Tax=Botryobacter ruber TaxID=2171629 RepID=UPI000E0A5114|nr:COX15/CtaA family protein [Botryobacter ruber]